MTKQEMENQEIARNYAEELNALARGELWKDARGEYTTTKPEGEDVELVDIWDWMAKNDLGDIRAEVDRDGTIWGVRVLVGFGGPDIWVSDGAVDVYWGGHGSWSLDDDAGDLVREYVTECMRGVAVKE